MSLSDSRGHMSYHCYVCGYYYNKSPLLYYCVITIVVITIVTIITREARALQSYLSEGV